MILRDAVKHPEFNRVDPKTMLVGEVEFQQDLTQNSDEVTAAVGYGTEGDDDECVGLERN